MSNSPFVVDSFDGLRLDAEPTEVGSGGAVDMLNIDLDRVGAIRTRDGYDNFTSGTGTNRYAGLFPFTRTIGGTTQLVALTASGANGTPAISALNTSGGIVASRNYGAGTLPFFNAARFGAPGSEYMYFADGTSTVVRWDGTSFTTPAGFPASRWLAVKPLDNRLATAVSSGSYSRVQFSDAGAPETWTSTSWVEISPGDGEVITGIVSWRDYLFVFKQTKFAVFTGTGTDPDGLPIFNYTMVDADVGILANGVLPWGAPPFVSAPPGVFFINNKGVWLTTGGPPTKISRALDPIFQNRVPASYTGPYLEDPFTDLLGASLAWHSDRLFVAIPDRGMFVWDSVRDRWMVWSVLANGLASWTSSNVDTLLFSYAAGSNHVGTFASGATAPYTTDDGTAITYRWKSGKYRPAGDSRTAVSLETAVFGTGSPTLTLSSDRLANQSGAVTLGTAPTSSEGWLQLDQEGVYWQHMFSGTGQMLVDSITHYISTVKPAGVQ